MHPERSPLLKQSLKSVVDSLNQKVGNTNQVVNRITTAILPSLASVQPLIDQMRKDLDSLKAMKTGKSTGNSQELINKLAKNWYNYEKQRMMALMLFAKYQANCEMFLASQNISNFQQSVQEIGAGIRCASQDLIVGFFLNYQESFQQWVEVPGQKSQMTATELKAKQLQSSVGKVTKEELTPELLKKKQEILELARKSKSNAQTKQPAVEEESDEEEDEEEEEEEDMEEEEGEDEDDDEEEDTKAKPPADKKTAPPAPVKK